jgi:hypothetical protein
MRSERTIIATRTALAKCRSENWPQLAPASRRADRIHDATAADGGLKVAGTVMRTMWTLEIHDETRGNRSLISSHSFDKFSDLKAKLLDNRGRAFAVRAPDNVAQIDLEHLADLRTEGFSVHQY